MDRSTGNIFNVNKEQKPAGTARRRFRPYPKYKGSGIEWIGKIPAGWEAYSLKRATSIRYGLGEPPQLLADGLPFIRATNVTRGRIVDRDMQFVDPNDVPWNRDPTLRTGDIIVVRSGAYTGDSAIIPENYDGAIAGYDMVVRVLEGQPRFLAWALLSRYVLNAQIEIESMRAAQPHLNAEELGIVTILRPPDLEQRAIAAFLDRETAKIDALIEKKERLIELLQEKRSALITKAVTKGLDPTVPMKDSGVEWLGKISENWNVRRLRFLVSINDETLSEKTDPQFEMIYVDIGGVDRYQGIFERTEYLFNTAPSRARRIVRDGDVIISTVRTYLRAITRIKSPENNLIVSTGFAVIRPTSRLNSEFAAYALRATYFIESIVANSTGVSYPAIEASTVSGFSIPFPEFKEQERIATYLNRETAKIDTLVAKVRGAIASLKEYRTALISAAVTGKIDVRDAS